jgi:hypothetical protein
MERTLLLSEITPEMREMFRAMWEDDFDLPARLPSKAQDTHNLNSDTDTRQSV